MHLLIFTLNMTINDHKSTIKFSPQFSDKHILLLKNGIFFANLTGCKKTRRSLTSRWIRRTFAGIVVQRTIPSSCLYIHHLDVNQQKKPGYSKDSKLDFLVAWILLYQTCDLKLVCKGSLHAQLLVIIWKTALSMFFFHTHLITLITVLCM